MSLQSGYNTLLANEAKRNQYQGVIRIDCVLQLVWRDETRSSWVVWDHLDTHSADHLRIKLKLTSGQ